MLKKTLFPALVLLLMLSVSFGLVPSTAEAVITQTAQTPLAGSAIPQFVSPLPDLHTIVAGAGQIELHMTEFKSNVLPTGTALPGGAAYTGTWVWGYLDPGQVASLDNANAAVNPSYIGPVIVATRGNPTQIKFVNDLGNSSTTNVLAYKNSTDQTLHWADPLNDGMNMGAHAVVPGTPASAPYNQNYDGPIPAVVHLHGGENPAAIDGGPDQWFTSDGTLHGSAFYTMDSSSSNYDIYRYPNTQQAAPLWFHDHTLGATRLNVYAGLAGAYLLTDPPNDPTNLPELVPLVIQDRMFDTNGQLFFPSDTLGGIQYSPNPEHPYWVPEFVGDTIVVNGKAWPYKAVDPKPYTFLFLNGSNARTYEFSMPSGVPMWIVATDGGYLDAPVAVKSFVMQPGERYEVVMDFSAFAGKTLILSNSARTPYPKGAPPQGSTVGRILQFRVSKTAAGTPFNPAIALRTGTNAIVRLANPVTGAIGAGVTVNKTRAVTLNEHLTMPVTATNPVTGALTKFPGGPTEILVNNTLWDGYRIDLTGNRIPIPNYTPDGIGNYLSEVPTEGETEVWEIINLTMDAHPIHLHLVQFQIMNRQAFNVSNYMKAYGALFPANLYQIDPATLLPYAGGVPIAGYGPPLDYNPSVASGQKYGGNPDVTLYLQGKVQPPAAYESGWKDTIIALPGMVTRIVVRWAPQGLAANSPVASNFFPFVPNTNGFDYVWHCHIIDHEDNEMMRPDQVTPNENAQRTYIMGVDY